MQKFQAAYEDMAKADMIAKRNGWDGGEGFLDALHDCYPRTYCVFPTKAEAEAWLTDEIAAGKTVFGCGDIDVLEAPKRRCRYCTCQGLLTVESYLVDDTGITQERDLTSECWDGED